tara:strand:+ start:49548 stop:50303 length:756 start_codon:yes stop_codon:yes gene_type:complete
MRAIALHIIIFVSSIVGAIPLWGEPVIEDRFFQGNQAYEQADFEDAISWYTHALAHGESVALRFNLGNAYYKAGKVGPAVYNYERALLMSPQDPDVHANLAFIRTTSSIYPEDKPLILHLAYLVSINVWIGWAVFSFWVLAFLLVIPKFLGGYSFWIKVGLVLSVSVFLLTQAALIGYHFDKERGFILYEETPLRVSPTQNGPLVTYLNAGQEVVFKQNYENYTQVRLSDKQEGWIPKASFIPLWRAQSTP